MRSVAAPLLGLTLLLGCEGEAIDLTAPLRDGGASSAGGAGGSGGSAGGPGGAGGRPDMAAAGGTGGGGSGGGGAGGGSSPIDWPTEAALTRFAEDVLPLYDSCAACHGAGTQRAQDADTIWPVPPEAPEPETIEAYFYEFEDAVVWGQPDSSPFLTASRGGVVSIQHPVAWDADSPADRQVAAFIAETRIPDGPAPSPDMGVPEEDMGPPPPADMGTPPGPAPGVPCEGLPVGDPLGREALFEDFDPEINRLLVDNCAEGICHGTPGNGGAYWLAVDEPCAVQWNYTVSLTFIDYRDPDRSPLTALPVSSDHGGRQVFNGRDDARFTRLLGWVRAVGGP